MQLRKVRISARINPLKAYDCFVERWLTERATALADGKDAAFIGDNRERLSAYLLDCLRNNFNKLIRTRTDRSVGARKIVGIEFFD
jgi:hypothetical protein